MSYCGKKQTAVCNSCCLSFVCMHTYMSEKWGPGLIESSLYRLVYFACVKSFFMVSVSFFSMQGLHLNTEYSVEELNKLGLFHFIHFFKIRKLYWNLILLFICFNILNTTSYNLENNKPNVCNITKWTYSSCFLFFFLFLLDTSGESDLFAVVSPSTSSLDGVRTNAYFFWRSRSASRCTCNSCWRAVLLATSSFAFLSGSKLEPSTKYSDMPKASRSLAFFSCCASAIWWVSRTLQ